MPEGNALPDLVQVGLTVEGQRDLDSIMETGWFATKQDVYVLAIAAALANDVIATSDQIRGAETRYSFSGGLDKEGKVRALISAFRPGDAAAPARTAERLAHAGLAILARKLSDEDALLSAALGYHENATRADAD
jgi:hypothetical protein